LKKDEEIQVLKKQIKEMNELKKLDSEIIADLEDLTVKWLWWSL
jgi:hypothetical protein